jgi:D-alanyl-D-alanine dipeptidase
MKKILLILFILFIHHTCFATSLSHSKQLMIVTTTDWNAVSGHLQRFERNSLQHPWKKVGKSIPVVIGKNGMAWGLSVKKEGDALTPAGVYLVGPAFGFAANNHFNINYLQLIPSSVCVDDVKSTYYNQLIDSDKVAHKDWNSGEQMREVAGYKLGAVIQYNDYPVTKGAGSCIFLHIWKNSTTGTAGCIAMEEANLKANLDWLDAKKHPVIAIFPMSVYQKVKMEWKLPSIV